MNAPAPFTSPSLSGVHRRSRAFEIKFILDEPTAAAVESMLSPHLSLDPHTDPRTGAYRITSIYCDTPAWEVYFREGPHATRKYRIRRYGDGPTFLERKVVRKSKVRKRRTPADASDLETLIHTDSGPDTAWFSRQVAHASLRPVCRVTYQRRALFGSCPDGPMRLTFDRLIQGHPISHWSFNGSPIPRPLLEEVVVCEFKFRDAMPAPMKSVVATLNLQPRGVSKYRACIAAHADSLGLPGNNGHA